MQSGGSLRICNQPRLPAARGRQQRLRRVVAGLPGRGRRRGRRRRRRLWRARRPPSRPPPPVAGRQLRQCEAGAPAGAGNFQDDVAVAGSSCGVGSSGWGAGRGRSGERTLRPGRPGRPVGRGGHRRRRRRPGRLRVRAVLPVRERHHRQERRGPHRHQEAAWRRVRQLPGGVLRAARPPAAALSAAPAARHHGHAPARARRRLRPAQPRRRGLPHRGRGAGRGTVRGVPLDGGGAARGGGGRERRGEAQRVQVRRLPGAPAGGAHGRPLRLRHPGRSKDPRGRVGHADEERGAAAPRPRRDTRHHPPRLHARLAVQRRGAAVPGAACGAGGERGRGVSAGARANRGTRKLPRVWMGQGRVRQGGPLPGDPEARGAAHGAAQRVYLAAAQDPSGQLLRAARELRVRGRRAGQGHVQGRRRQPAGVPAGARRLPLPAGGHRGVGHWLRRRRARRLRQRGARARVDRPHHGCQQLRPQILHLLKVRTRP